MPTTKRIGLLTATGVGGSILLLLAWFYLSMPAPPKPPPNLVARTTADTSVELPDVRAELLRMQWVDQKIRQQFADSLRAGSVDGLSGLLGVIRYSYLESRVDEANTVHLKELVNKHGWLNERRVGPKGAEAAFLIAQHADHDLTFQKKVLGHVQQAYQAGTASGQQLGLLTDRVRIAEGNPQLYGTQAQIRNGELHLSPITDSANVDQRRADVGLPPLSEYIAIMKEKYEHR